MFLHHDILMLSLTSLGGEPAIAQFPKAFSAPGWSTISDAGDRGGDREAAPPT